MFSLSVVITGTVTESSLASQGRLVATVSIIKAYKDGGLTINQVGKTMTVKMVLNCRTCPVIRRGNLRQIVKETESDKLSANDI